MTLRNGCASDFHTGASENDSIIEGGYMGSFNISVTYIPFTTEMHEFDIKLA